MDPNKLIIIGAVVVAVFILLTILFGVFGFVIAFVLFLFFLSGFLYEDHNQKNNMKK